MAAISVVALGALTGLTTPASAELESATVTQLSHTTLPSPGLDGDTKARGKNGDVAVVGKTAFVAGGANYHGARATSGRICTDFGGVKVVDLTNPSSPNLRAPISIEDTKGVGAPWPVGNPRRAEAATGRRFNNVSNTANAVDARPVDVPGFKGDLLAIAVARCEPNFFGQPASDPRVEFWDVSDPANPVLKGRFSDGFLGTVEDVRLVQRAGKVYSLNTVAFGASQSGKGDLRYLDVTPLLDNDTNTNATEVGDYPSPAPAAPVGQVSANGCQTFIGGRSVAPSADGSHAFLSFYDGTQLFGSSRTEALLDLDLDNLPKPNANTPPPYTPAPPSFGYSPTDKTVEGNAADVEPFTAGGKQYAILSEDDVDPALTNLNIAAPGLPGSDFRVCELAVGAKLHQLPNQQQAGDLAYVGRGCPASKLSGSPNQDADVYLADPAGKIAVLDSGPSPFDGCSAFERYQRAIAAGATAVVSNTGGNDLSATNSGPAGGIPSKPTATMTLEGYRKIQYQPTPTLSGTTFPTTYERSSTTNVTVEPSCVASGTPPACPAGTPANLRRTDISRFKSVANATDPVARGEVNSASPTPKSTSCDDSTCRFAVVPGQQYRAGAFMEVQARTAGSFVTGVVWYDSSGTALSSSEIKSLDAVTPRTRYEQTVTAPAGAARASVRFRWVDGGSGTGGTAFVDGFSFSPAGLNGTLKDTQGEWGAQRIIDFSQSPPAEVGSFRSPRSKQFPPPDGGIYQPRLARMFGPDAALSTWMSDGLRVVDLSSPASPKEVGSFVPPAVDDPSPDAGAGSTSTPPLRTDQSLQLKRGAAWPNQTLVTGVDVLSRSGDTGTVVVTDINGGLYVLRVDLKRSVAGGGVGAGGGSAGGGGYPLPATSGGGGSISPKATVCPNSRGVRVIGRTNSGGRVFQGTSGNDRICGTSAGDLITGNGGKDVISAGGGNDRLNGGSGNDRINGGSGKDLISGGSGNDGISGGSGNDRVNGNSGRDRISGGSGNDRLSGSSGNDRISGNSGNDRIFGGSGRDVLKGGSGRDRISGGSGNDRLSGGSGRDRVSGGLGRDRGR